MAPSPLDKQQYTTQLADEFSHGFSCFVRFMEVKMASLDAIWLFSVWM